MDLAPFLPQGLVAALIQHQKKGTCGYSFTTHTSWRLGYYPSPAVVGSCVSISRHCCCCSWIFGGYLYLNIRSIKRSYFGKALARFRNVFDRDNLIVLGSQQTLGYHIHSYKDNEAWNFRALNFNRECWIMLLGFHLDFWAHDHIQNAIESFGRLLMWEPNQNKSWWFASEWPRLRKLFSSLFLVSQKVFKVMPG